MFYTIQIYDTYTIQFNPRTFIKLSQSYNAASRDPKGKKKMIVKSEATILRILRGDNRTIDIWGLNSQQKLIKYK